MASDIDLFPISYFLFEVALLYLYHEACGLKPIAARIKQSLKTEVGSLAGKLPCFHVHIPPRSVPRGLILNCGVYASNYCSNIGYEERNNLISGSYLDS
jgi:hypothetical protein